MPKILRKWTKNELRSYSNYPYVTDVFKTVAKIWKNSAGKNQANYIDLYFGASFCLTSTQLCAYKLQRSYYRLNGVSKLRRNKPLINNNNNKIWSQKSRWQLIAKLLCNILNYEINSLAELWKRYFNERGTYLLL